MSKSESEFANEKVFDWYRIGVASWEIVRHVLRISGKRGSSSEYGGLSILMILMVVGSTPDLVDRILIGHRSEVPMQLAPRRSS